MCELETEEKVSCCFSISTVRSFTSHVAAVTLANFPVYLYYICLLTFAVVARITYILRFTLTGLKDAGLWDASVMCGEMTWGFSCFLLSDITRQCSYSYF